MRFHEIVAWIGSSYFTIALAIERYIAVYYPLRAKSILTRNRSLKLSVAVCAIAFLLQIPLIILELTHKFGPIETSDYQCLFGRREKALKLNPSWNTYTLGLYLVAFFVPNITIFILNSLILWKVCIFIYDLL